MGDLHLPLKGEYFDAIVSGEKPFEYREDTPYWRKRLEGRAYDSIVLTRGYPRKDDQSRRHVIPYRGFVKQTINHPHFDGENTRVFAIHVTA